MKRVGARLSLALSLSGLVAGCGGSGWYLEMLFDEPTVLSSEASTRSYEFRTCKDGGPIDTIVEAKIGLRTSGKHGGGDVVIRQWATREDFEAGEPGQEVGRAPAGEVVRAPLEIDVPLALPGHLCGPWSVFEFELDGAPQGQSVDIKGSLEVEIDDSENPLDDFSVEMPHH